MGFGIGALVVGSSLEVGTRVGKIVASTTGAGVGLGTGFSIGCGV